MPAFLLNPLIRWAAVAVAIGVLFGWALWERHDAQAALKGEKAALLQADLSAQDAKRWHDASDLRDQAIAGLRETLDRQNAAVSKLQFSLTQANAAASKAEAESRDARASFDQRMQEIEAEAEKAPADVRGLGPIVLKRVGGLWE